MTLSIAILSISSISSGGINSGGAVSKFAKPKLLQRKPVIDARNKIIQKNRAKIHDARDKLGEFARRGGDARIKLLKKNINTLKKYGELGPALNAVKRASAPNQNIGLKTRKQQSNALNVPIYQRGKVNEMDMDVDYFPSSNNLRRTVKNELSYTPASTMPPLPTFKNYIEPTRRLASTSRPTPEYEADPFDCYEVPNARPFDVSEPRNLNRSVHEAHMDGYPRKGILRTSSGNGISSLPYERLSMSTSQYKTGNDLSKHYIADENSHLSHQMRNRLQRAPDINQSAGIFSNPYIDGLRDERHLANDGYRIVVSNLHSSVSQSDIKVNYHIDSHEF